jgi:hypothetical protein
MNPIVNGTPGRYFSYKADAFGKTTLDFDQIRQQDSAARELDSMHRFATWAPNAERLAVKSDGII